jgi:rhodanese-related sulfurtransferase
VTKTVSRESLHARIQAGDPPILLEALPERYYAQKHLPGALLFPHDQVAELAPRLLANRAAPIVVYCASRTCQNSHVAAQRLLQLGYTDVSVYAGGKQDWEEAGLPFETAEAATA